MSEAYFLVGVNIFICHTPFQVFMSKQIVEQNFISSYTNIIISTVPVSEHIAQCFTEVFQVRNTSTAYKLIDTFKAKALIDDYVKREGDNMQIFIPHTGALLDNYCFFSLKKRKKSLKINFFYEGVLYLYKYIQPEFKLAHLKKWIMAFSLGYLYRFDREIFPANRQDVHRIYTLFPKETLGPTHKKIAVNLLKTEFKAKPNCCIVLGTRTGNFTLQETVELYQTMLKSAQQQGFTEVYFKGHHEEQCNSFEKAAKKSSLHYKDISQPRPVEELIGEYKPRAIFSFASSALLNIKATYGEEIKVSSYSFASRKKTSNHQIWEAFEKVNIELHFQ